MDLESTLIRAEQLFRRFHRLVEAVDKKQNFPPPRFAPPRTSSSSNAEATDETTPSPQAKGKKREDGLSIQNKVITPELRKLLSREVEFIQKKPKSLKRSATAAE
jgi:TBC1 domain family member 15